MTTIWHLSHGYETFDAFHQNLRALDHDRLANGAANDLLNTWCADVADFRETDREPHGFGKRLPYIGWYWRSVDFAGGHIPVGDCGDFIGFMENNKWDHPERSLTAEEADRVTGLLWRARTEEGRGGNVADSWAARDAVLGELWEWMQGLVIEP